MARCDTQLLYDFDLRIEAGLGCRVAGLDEAGRGPLAGPVVAAAVMLDLGRPIPGVNDSKKLSAKKRDELYGLIIAGAAAWAVGEASVEEIDKHNILQASLLAMKRALDAMSRPWSLALVDGNRGIPDLDNGRQLTVVGGDGKSASIAAASIIAKVTRDRIMASWHGRYPAYEFSLHKGYGTALHRERIRQLGLCEIHRKSFCANLVSQTAMDLAITAPSPGKEPQ
ncbi:MAG TPA: ribonuclease HII [Chitinivibrionales bacterium]|nr:ribonuclease HII [Chitinivibrionales bacterium]